MKNVQIKVLSSSVIMAALVSLAAPANSMPVKPVDLTVGSQIANTQLVQYGDEYGYGEGVEPSRGNGGGYGGARGGYGGAPGIVGPEGTGGYGGAPGIVEPGDRGYGGAPNARVDNRDGYLNGHRGYRERRAGYREFRGYWYPLEAFPEGIVDGPKRNIRPQPALSARHVSWCSNRWRSYRSSDNSYQPSSGPRRECISPFSR